MKRFMLLAMGVFLIFMASAEAQMPAYRPGELLVKFKPHTRSAALDRSESSLGIRVQRSLGNDGLQHVVLPPELSVSEALTVLNNDPDVEFAEPNYLLVPQTIPDDPLFDRQWGLNNAGQAVGGYLGTDGSDIDAVRAWGLDTGSDTAIVAVVDTGCNIDHPDLTANVWTNDGEIPDNGIDDDHNGYIDDIHGWDFADRDNNPQDATGHGTHVAGIIAAQGDNGIGVTGVGWQVRIMPLRFMNAFDVGTVSDAITAIEYAAAKGVRIINCSWGSSGYSSALYNTMASVDALFVCAAGNNGTSNDTYGFYPAAYALDNVISVAAGDQMDQLAWFSNYGLQRVHLAAPGVRIYSLGYDRRTVWLETFSDGQMDGWVTGGDPDTWTIMAAPQTAGSTVLAVGPDDTYPNNADTWAISPALDLSRASACKLTFQLIGTSEAYRDYLYIEVSTDMAGWSSRPVYVGGSIKYSGISGSYPYWTTVTADLGPLDGSAQFYVRFRFKSNSDTTATGYFIDNVTLSAASDEEAYQFMSGTSMAAGFVSGIAGLLLSQHSSLGPWALKQMLMDSVDLTEDFADYTAAGGRSNAYNALMLANDPDYVVRPRSEAPASAAQTGSGFDMGCFIGQLFGSIGPSSP